MRWRVGIAAVVAAGVIWQTSGPPADAADLDCRLLEVTYPRGHTDRGLSGRYSMTSKVINDAPVYRAVTTRVDAPPQFAMNYLYRHKVAFTQSGFVWVTQPEPPNPPEWLANAYGDGETPETAVWTDEIEVDCLGNAPDHTVHRDPDKTIDIAIVFTPDADLALKDLGFCRKDTEPFCGGRSYAKQVVREMNTALEQSKVDGGHLRIVHIGPIDLPEAELIESRSLHQPPIAKMTPAEKRGKTRAEIDRFNSTREATAALRFAVDLFNEPAKSDGIPQYRSYVPQSIRDLHGRRKAFEADLVHVVFNNLPGGCGIGDFAVKREATGHIEIVPGDGYSLSQINCNKHGLLAPSHEIGHNLGLKHSPEREAMADRTQSAGDINVGNGRGYVDKANGFVTIMGYAEDCAPTECRVKPYFSNKDLTLRLGDKDVPLGNRKSNSADTLNKNLRIVSKFFTSESKVLSFWPPETMGDQPYAAVEMARSGSEDIVVSLFNPSDHDLLIENFTGSPMGSVAVHSLASGRFMPCRKGKKLLARSFCTFDLDLTANEKIDRDMHPYSILVEYRDLSTRAPGNIVGTINYRKSE